ncbi:hypothetical protein [Microbacterium arabinogalactanolyticum]|uniref:hypothetical protein n=1 Tax=Microbacterium arabinogalactanolyticum TaxID=69365 RepID=UPI002556D558|nr:hypothetical protein [Microbacterium arabinogalactanolyticum]GLC84663.1 hypothetical protein MIAR_12510 [Microbacterium arabinogalactanolyticum]
MIELDDIDTDEDGALTATVELPGGRRVTVEYEFDEDFDRDDEDEDSEDDDDDDVVDVEPEDLPDMDTMQETVQHALARLTQEILDEREREVAEELTEAAYEDDDDGTDLAEALQSLKDDIALDGVVVFGDGGITLLYVAPEEYPDLIIYCLLDEDLEIDDLMVE